MKILDFVPANCKNCYKCVRNCTVKAIKVINDQAQIVEDRCIACGKCFLVCPQNARYILSDLDKLLNAIKQKKKVIISIAPSYLGIYKEPYRLIGALRKLGVDIIEETSIGASLVTELYKQYIQNSNGKAIITTACPSVNLMIQKYFPDLINNIIPVDSPMIVHAKMLRKEYGKDAYITFLGPCIAKKCEAYPYQLAGIIDAVISFEELEKYFIENKIEINECDSSLPDKLGNKLGQSYPMSNGILGHLEATLKEKNYTSISVTGTHQCKEIFEDLLKNNLKEQNIFIEANSCEGGCIGGPATPKETQSVFMREVNIRDMLDNSPNSNEELGNEFPDIIFSRRFRDKHIARKQYTEEEIKSVLLKIEKKSESDELNCSACGYESCRQKAIAVLEGMSYPEMCMPYMRNKAERITNISFEYSPNMLFLVDENFNILDLNPKAQQAFSVNINNISGKNLSLLMPIDDCEEVIKSEQNILNKKIVIDKYGIKAYCSLIYIPDVKIIFIILLDVTEEENKKDQLLKLKLSTIETTNKVIEKQMRVAQEIAGLLGETTAETKTTLLKLKNIVTNEESDI